MKVRATVCLEGDCLPVDASAVHHLASALIFRDTPSGIELNRVKLGQSLFTGI